MIYKHSQTLIKGAVIFLVAPFILISQSTAAVATVASPTLTGGSEGVNSAVLVSGSPISENATVADTTTVLLSASALLTPGQETRTLSMEFDSKTVYTLNSAQAPEGWTLNYLTPSGSTTTQPGTNTDVVGLRAVGSNIAAGSISGTNQNYSTETTSKIPSNTFSTASGGDGWGVTFYEDYVFSIWHHSTQVDLICNSKSANDAGKTPCPWDSAGSSGNTKTTFSNYRTGGRTDAWINPQSGKLYALVAPTSSVTGFASDNDTSGFLCIDIATAIQNRTAPVVCSGGHSGYFAGSDSQTVTNNVAYGQINDITNVGTRIFGFDASRSPNAVLCFDTAINARCANSPILVPGASHGGGNGWAPSTRILAIGTQIFVVSSGVSSYPQAHCFNAADLTRCTGWETSKVAPATQTGDQLILPHQDTTGVSDGFCTWSNCYKLNGETTTAWTNPFSAFAEAKTGETWWSRGVDTLGRVYFPGGNRYILCFDYIRNAACNDFGSSGKFDANVKSGLLYDIRVDPVNPACLWVNDNNGVIFNLSYQSTGSYGCGDRPVITLQPSQFAPRYACSTANGIASWSNITLKSITGGSASTIKLTIKDALGNSIAGWTDKTITLNTRIDMSSLDVALTGSRPTFSFAFSGISGTPTSAIIALEYLGKGPELCANAILTSSRAVSGANSYLTSTLVDPLSATPTMISTRTFLIGNANAGAQYTVPETPTALSGSGLNTSATLTFTPPINTGGVALRSYYYSLNGGSSYVEATGAVNNGNGTWSIPLTGLTPGTTYSIKVRATNEIGNGPSASLTLTAQKITLNTLADIKLNLGPLTMDTATVDTYTVTTAPVCTVSGNIITLVSVGVCTVNAYKAGDASNLAVSTTKSFNVLAADIVITAPDSPTALAGSPSSTQVSLSWTAPAQTGGAPITDYKIYYKSASTWIPFTDGVSTNTFVTVTGLTNGTAYDFKVSAVNSSSLEGEYSSVITKTPASTPGTVTSLAEASRSGTSATLTWTAPTSTGGSAITDYLVQYKFDTDTAWVTFTDAVSATTGASVTGLLSGVAYNYQVSATNAIGTGSPVNTVTLKSNDGNAQSTLTWTAPSSPGGSITGYRVEHRIVGENTWTVGSNLNTDTGTVLTGLTNGVSYQIRVGAIVGGSIGAYTSTALSTPFTVPSAPSVTGVAGLNQIALSWSAPANNGSAITDYVIQYRTGAGSWTTKTDGVNTNTSYVLPSLVNGSTYEVQIAAVNAAGTGAYSTAITATPYTIPGAVRNLAATPGGASALISWQVPLSDGGGALTDYAVQYKTLLGTQWLNYPHAPTTATSITISSLAVLADYSFRIAAVNGVGTGPYSDAISGRTLVVETPVDPAPTGSTQAAPVVLGPPPSTFVVVERPKISRSGTTLLCSSGTYKFKKQGGPEEASKISSQQISLLSNGAVVDSEKTLESQSTFEGKSSYKGTTLSCEVGIKQEEVVKTYSSIDPTGIASFEAAMTAAIYGANTTYYSERDVAYMKRDAGDTKLWKEMLEKALVKREGAKAQAGVDYLANLEKAGISLVIAADKAVPTPAPTPTPAPEKSPEVSITGNVQPIAMKKVGSIYFASGTYFLNDESKKTIKALATSIFLKSPEVVLSYGHTDVKGGTNNTLLSQNRAKAVAKLLRSLLPGQKIVTGWYASSKPVATGTSKAALAKNRRVEIYIK
jgi:outer membrane protein OmpA-like peptidoglycan-associated protein